MDEKLKQQIMIAVIPAGFILAALTITFTFMGWNMLAIYGTSILAGLIVGGATFGVVYFLQKDQ